MDFFVVQPITDSPFLPSRPVLEARLAEMLRMQERLNETVNRNWRAANYAWHRAIYTEAAEFIEHLGQWKWWKKSSPNLPAAKMELVDIWHFALSSYLNRWSETSPLLAPAIAARMVRTLDDLPAAEAILTDYEAIHQEVDRMIGAAGKGSFDIGTFVRLLWLLGMTFGELHARYVGKNALNVFRQDQGYKQGTYAKIWYDGREDNDHLEDIVLSVSLGTSAQLEKDIRVLLESRYRQACAASV